MKNNAIKFPIIAVAVFLLGSLSCKKDENNSNNTTPPAPTDSVYTLTPYSIITHARFPEIAIPADNQPYVEKIQLGRRLYYDVLMSNDGRSCGGCHNQQYGFTKPVPANTMPILPHENMAWYTNFMWDGSKSGTLEELMLFETKDFLQTDLDKINNDPTYKTLFKKYFKVDYITHKEIAYALAQFVRILISQNSKYDDYFIGAFPLNADEEAGRDIFFSEKGDCFHCHSTLMMTDNQFHNTGLDSDYTNIADRGRYTTTNNPADMGKFRTPNLRNVALRSRYMHDGRFTSLMDVINFYDHGVKHNGNLDPIMTKPGKENGLKLNELQKQQLVAFLNTLTDSTFINNPSLKSPF
jgi:cytochrome c peroxidase